MKRWINSMVVAVAVCLMAGVGQAQSLSSLEGEWKALSGTLHGQAVPAGAIGSMKLTITSGTFRGESGGLISSGTVVVDGTGTNRLKFMITGGADIGRTLNAIYHVSGTTLSIAFSESQSFPEGFDSTATNRSLVMVYQLSGLIDGSDQATGGTGGTGARSQFID